MQLHKKNILFYLSNLCFILLSIELFSFTAMVFLEKKRIVYKPLKISESEYKDYLNKRNQILGWPSPSQYGQGLYDKSGSRYVPVLFPGPATHNTCVSLYGDSYTYGAMVTDDKAWSNILSLRLNCRVSNYGVVGYGTDQAYLRFHENRRDNAPIVVLGFLSENILRNVNQYRPLLYHNIKTEKLGLKPRFITDNAGDLRFIPLPKYKYEDFLQVVRFPQKYLEYEYFLPQGQAGIQKNEFPYTISLMKVMSRNFHIKAKIKGMTWYSEFYDVKHPSKALAVTFGIIKRFFSEAQERHSRLIVLLIPTEPDLEYYIKNKEWTYQSLKELVQKDKIEVIDAGPKMIEYLGNRRAGDLYIKRHHFNAEGEKVLADIVYGYLKDNSTIVSREIHVNR